MERIIVVNWAVLCVSILLFELVSSVPHYHQQQHDSLHQRNVKGEPGNDSKESYMWFGPRLGRKKRHYSNNDFYENVQKEKLATLMDDVIRDTPWAAILVGNDGKRHVLNFTPRLGRESGEELMNGLPPAPLPDGEHRWLQDPELSEELLSQRSPPFAPRLGRHLSPFSPRLGRENDKMSFS